MIEEQARKRITKEKPKTISMWSQNTRRDGTVDEGLRRALEDAKIHRGLSIYLYQQKFWF